MDAVRMYDYLTESRRRLFDVVRGLDASAYRAEHPIGLGSVARTLHHIRGAEWAYMERIRGRTEPIGEVAGELDPEVSTADALAFAPLERGWTQQSARTRSDLLAVEDWSAPRVYRTQWENRPLAYRATAGDIFAQLALHEVHHRAQVLHMLHRLGVGPMEIDYNTLMWTHVDPAGDEEARP